MILGIFAKSFTVTLNINIFLIDKNIRNNENTYKSKKKNFNLVVR